ncbi:MAG: hypothetical protein ABI806_00085 [Candidatus Solibacter sp.]
MTEGLRTLLAGLIDYAGLFPPASLEMAEARRNYVSYAAGEHAWALGRFVVPAARLDEVDPAWKCSVIGMPKRVVDSCEIKVDRASDVPALFPGVMPGVVAYYEMPITEDPAPLAGATGRAKVRTGGLTAAAFPSDAALAGFMARCAAAKVPFKATAGLHHPLRSVQRCTYAADSPSALMHGFVNVFVAAASLWHGGTEAEAAATLEEQSASAFAWDDAGVAWHGQGLTVEQLRAAREQFAISFGSCSFEEPVRDLQQLGWL